MKYGLNGRKSARELAKDLLMLPIEKRKQKLVDTQDWAHREVLAIRAKGNNTTKYYADFADELINILREEENGSL